MFLPEIDLHLHSTASDGTHSPAQLVEMASQMDLAAIAVADHDTVSGQQEAMGAGEEWGVEVVPAIEIGSYFGGRSIHIVGYFIDPHSRALRTFAEDKRKARAARAEEMVRRLAAAGIPIAMAQVEEKAQGGVIGRVHVAQVLTDNGVVGSVKEGFQDYLRRGCPYYVTLKKPAPEEAIAVIRKAGGIASLAHPVFIKEELLRELLPSLVEAGLGAIEVLYGFDPDYGLTAGEHLARCSEMGAIASRLGLARTGGSDFHGVTVKDQEMGSAHVPLQFLDELKWKHHEMKV